jgi:hypothetical protein
LFWSLSSQVEYHTKFFEAKLWRKFKTFWAFYLRFELTSVFLLGLYFSTRFYVPTCVHSMCVFFHGYLFDVIWVLGLKYWTSKVVASVYSHHKSSKVCSLLKTALSQKFIWFINNNIFVILKITPLNNNLLNFGFTYELNYLSGGLNKW